MKSKQHLICFLISFERNNIPYYGAIVDSMKTLSSPEMHIHFDHIWSYAPELAHDLCQCYPRWLSCPRSSSYESQCLNFYIFCRIQKNLENAVCTFIRDLNLPGFHCENPVICICDMPKPDRYFTWVHLNLVNNNGLMLTLLGINNRVLYLQMDSIEDISEATWVSSDQAPPY